MIASPGEESATAALVRELAAAWLPEGMTLERRQRWRMRRALLRIGAARGVADPLARSALDPGTRRYQQKVIGGAVTAFLCRSAGITPPEVPRFGIEARGSAVMERVVSAGLVTALDAHAASAAELAALPGLGPVSARRIVARRTAQGSFTDLDDLRRAAGISNAAMERARPFLYLGTAQPPQVRAAVEARLRQEGMGAFLKLWQAGELEASHLDGLGPGEAMVTQLELCAKRAQAAPTVPRLWAPRRQRLREGSRALARAEALSAGAARDGVRIAPVFSAGYLPVLQSLIAAAETEIAASIFYFTVGDPDVEGDPGDTVVTALVEAMARGVQVRLILDMDLPPDRHGARLVNDAVFEVLEARGVPFRRDHMEISSHAKMIAVDRRRVLLGSHNWTASAFFRYQETSVLVDSEAMGAQVAGLLDRRWDLLAPAAARIVPVELLESLTPEERLGLQAEGLADGPDFAQATRLKAQREVLGARIDMAEARLDRTRRIVQLMQSFRISETLAYALVADGLDAPSEVARAAAPRLARALTRLPELPPPFAYREILPETAEWLAEEEV